jgi:hypothetical protein
MIATLMTAKSLEEFTKNNVSQSGFFTEQATKSARDFVIKMTGVKDFKFSQTHKGTINTKEEKKKKS